MTPREEMMLAVLKAVANEMPESFRAKVNQFGRVVVMHSSETIESVFDAIDQIEMEDRMEAMAAANDSEAAELGIQVPEVEVQDLSEANQ